MEVLTTSSVSFMLYFYVCFFRETSVLFFAATHLVLPVVAFAKLSKVPYDENPCIKAITLVQP